MANLVDVITIQGWNHLFEPTVPYLHEPEVREFFYKMKLLESGGITTIVRNMEIHLDEETLGIILGVPVAGVWTIEGCKTTGDFSKILPNEEMSSVQGSLRSFSKGSIH
ncbi:hypothetical protein R3W88_023288 [Solanum pinnatisectum]|uniref:Uncharacterized protein n=1 Tax=Solanum pinnatisectum TaxID=50273 RepID=A0AAV9LX16_9SOLN|nr:hypothetical protein R3W88_023288 [Solanum pinnatisectum]